MVAERAAGGLEVVDALGQRVAGEVDAVGREAGSRRRGTPSAYARERLLAEEVAECSSAETTSGQSSRDDPSTPR